MSKFIGKSYNGWKVVADVNADRKHKYFLLVEDKLVQSMIFVRDNDMTELEKGTKTVQEILEGKEKTLAKDSSNVFATEFVPLKNINLNI